MRSSIVSFLVLLLSASSFAQVELLDRIEIDYKDEFYVKGLYNFGEHGVVLSAVEDVRKSRRDPKRMYVFYDKDLIELESFEVDVPFRRKISATYEGEKQLHTFYYDKRNGEFNIVTIDSRNTSRIEYEGEIAKKQFINQFKVIGKTAVLYTSTKRDKFLHIIDLETSTVKKVPFKKIRRSNSIYVIDIQCLPGEEEITVLFQEYQKKIMLSTSLYVINKDGEVSDAIRVNAGNWNIVDGTPTRLENGELIIAGTYSQMKSTGAAGMFVCSFTEGEQNYFNIYDFNEFDNFFEYLSDRAKKKLEKKKKRKARRGKELQVNVRMAIHNVEERDGQLYLLGEAYYPTYRTESYTTYVNGRPTTQYRTVFDGYQYTHAVLSVFDMDGEKLEDHTFKMWLSYKPMYVRRNIELNVDDDIVKMVVVDGTVLRTKILDQGDVVDTETVNLVSETAGDRIRYASIGTVEFFYDNSFISYGKQVIKNKQNKKVKKKRNVFYMQKILIE